MRPARLGWEERLRQDLNSAQVGRQQRGAERGQGRGRAVGVAACPLESSLFPQGALVTEGAGSCLAPLASVLAQGPFSSLFSRQEI